MCLMNNTSASRGTAPVVAPEPTRATVTAASTVDQATQIAKAKTTAKKRLGYFGNVATTPMGDASYGANIAAFGAAA